MWFQLKVPHQEDPLEPLQVMVLQQEGGFLPAQGQVAVVVSRWGSISQILFYLLKAGFFLDTTRFWQTMILTLPKP